MKKVECIISNQRFQELEKALRSWGVRGVTVSDVRGYGNEQTRPESFLFLPKTKVELYCTDAEVGDIAAIIERVCKTGKLGDGKIAVFDVENMIRIRTGERGEVAI
jgi:nitrogen regulatory protein P-II 1